MARGRFSREDDPRFQDRGQPERFARAGAAPPVRQRGGFSPTTLQQPRGFIPPPGIARARKNTIQRPINQPVAGAPTKTGGGRIDRGTWAAMASQAVRAGKKRMAPTARRTTPPQAGSELRFGVPTGQSAEEIMARGVPGRQLGQVHRPGEVNPALPVQLRGAPGEPQTKPISAPPSPANQRRLEETGAPVPGNPAAPSGKGQSQVMTPPGAPSPQEQQARTEAFQGKMFTQGGTEVTPPPAQPEPPQMSSEGVSREIMQQGAPAQIASVGMGERALGMDMSNSDRVPGGREFKGEIGPGLPSNSLGALGVPGATNRPEDIAHNQERFKMALQQNRGDQYQAALSSGSFPSGNPMAEGTIHHAKDIAESIGGDGIDPKGLPAVDQKRYKADSIRQLEEFGPYPGMEDPDAPTPPIRPMGFSFNPLTGKWIAPEGRESLLDRFGGGNG